MEYEEIKDHLIELRKIQKHKKERINIALKRDGAGDSIAEWNYIESKNYADRLESLLEIPEKNWTDEMFLDIYKAKIYLKNHN